MSSSHPLNQQARRLRRHLLEAHHLDLNVSDAQTLVARSHGHRSWQAAKAALSPATRTPQAYLVTFHDDLNLGSDTYLIVNGVPVDTISSEDAEVTPGTARYFVSRTLRALTGTASGPDPVQDLTVTPALAATLNLQQAADEHDRWDDHAALAAWVALAWAAQQRAAALSAEGPA